MVPEKYAERMMIGIFNMIQFEDFSGDVFMTTNKGNNDLASLWEFMSWLVSKHHVSGDTYLVVSSPSVTAKGLAHNT